MTRRKNKQTEFAFYMPDGDAGEVHVIEADENLLWGLSVWRSKQTAEQYADWLATQHNLSYAPYARTMKVATRMKDVA